MIIAVILLIKLRPLSAANETQYFISTTANIYAHVMEEADQKNADILADIFLKKA